MANNKWMFGASSKIDLSSIEKEKRTYYNRDMPDTYSEGGLQIGANENADNARKQKGLSYKAQLDFDIANRCSDGLPDAKKRTAYDFARPSFDPDDHPLGRSSMKVGVCARVYLDNALVHVCR